MIFDLYLAISAEHPDVSDWEAESIAIEFGEDMVDYISACNLLYHTNLPWENRSAFEKCALVINDRMVIGDVIQDLDSKEISYTGYIMKKHFKDEDFNDEVCSYMIAELMEDGIVICPDVLAFLQPHIPRVFLSDEQERLQVAYIDEIGTYIAVKGGEAGEV